MSDALVEERVAAVAGAASARRVERIQSVWSGHGELVRYTLDGGPVDSVVVKHIRPGRGRGRSYDRKLRSYQVEQTWYTKEGWADRCGDACRVARCLHAERAAGEWLFVLEDLDAAGFPKRTDYPSRAQLDVCLRWLATFHATFMGERPRGLWKIGTYWHLATRPDELRKMEKGPLRAAAAAIDERLNGARFKTIVHGDAKPATFCFSRDGRSVAAVDFQYVGGGCGVRDVAYLLSGEDAGAAKRSLGVYFQALAQALAGRDDVDAAAVEAEWRGLYAWAAADFQRFLAGWAPGWRVKAHEQALTKKVIAALKR